MSLDENAVGKATTATYVENGETLTVGDRDLLRLKAFTEAYLAASPVPSDTENPSADTVVKRLREAEFFVREGFAAGRAAAHPDPRVPSGLPIGYGGPTVKTDPVALLAQIKAIVDEPLDERDGYGPTRTGQFARIDALLRDVPPAPAASPDPPGWACASCGAVSDRQSCRECGAECRPAASPDERLREARAIVAKIPQEQLARIMQSVRAEAAADREAPDGEGCGA